MARLGNMSRATFTRLFQKALDQTPMQYLTDWRMALARDLLSDHDLVLDTVARRVGYSSGYSFATVFRRHHYETPGRWRNQAMVNAGPHGAAGHRTKRRATLTSPRPCRRRPENRAP